MKDAHGHGSNARGAAASPAQTIAAQHGIDTSHLSSGPLARWQSAGGKWAAELHSVSGGYRLSETKNGNEVGASFRPGAGQSKYPESELKDDAAAVSHFDNHVKNSFDVGMKRVK